MINKITLCSLSGRAGSGKDLVCKIIQLIERWEDASTGTNFKKEYSDIVDFIEYHLELGSKSSVHLTSKWENKKFATKLKQIAAILLGVPVEKFEDREFKNSLLGEEWGKNISMDIVPQYLIEEIEYKVNGDIIRHKSVRRFLQELGTEAIRHGLHPKAWVNALFTDFKTSYIYNSDQVLSMLEDMGYKYDDETQDFVEDAINEGFKWSEPQALYSFDEDNIKDTYWIITDARFINELETVANKGGFTVLVNADKRLDTQRVAQSERLAQIELSKESDDIFYQDKNGDYHLMNNAYQDKFTNLYNKYYKMLEDSHSSENEWKDWKFDYVIDNNKDLRHLIKEVIKFYKKFDL